MTYSQPSRVQLATPVVVIGPVPPDVPPAAGKHIDTFDAACWSDVPRDVQSVVVSTCGPVWGAVLSQVNRNLRDIVAEFKANDRWPRKSTVSLNDLRADARLLALAKGQGISMNSRLWQMAARNGNLEVLKWGRENGVPTQSGSVATLAAAGGHLDVLSWALENGSEWTQSCCSSAAVNGHQHVLEWAKRNRLQCMSTMTSAAAAKGGHLHLLRWLHEEGCPWDQTASSAAAGSGHFTVLQFLRWNGCPWDQTTCQQAARAGDLPMLRWARTNGCPWDFRTVRDAVYFGHLEVVEWATQHGCRYGRLSE